MGAVMAASPRAPGSPCSRSAGCTASRALCRSTAAGCPSPGCAAPRGGRRRSAASRGSQVRSSSWSAALPTRIGGLDQIRSNRTSSGMPSAVAARTPSRPSAAALRRVRSSARSLTSSAQTRGGGGAQGEGERDRAPAAAEVEEGAGAAAASGASSSSTRGALVEAAGREDAGRHLDVDLAAGEAHASCGVARRRWPGRR